MHEFELAQLSKLIRYTRFSHKAHAHDGNANMLVSVIGPSLALIFQIMAAENFLHTFSDHGCLMTAHIFRSWQQAARFRN